MRVGPSREVGVGPPVTAAVGVSVTVGEASGVWVAEGSRVGVGLGRSVGMTDDAVGSQAARHANSSKPTANVLSSPVAIFTLTQPFVIGAARRF